MSDDGPRRLGGGHALGGDDGPPEQLPPEWAARAASGGPSRVGRIGQWGGASSSSASRGGSGGGRRIATLRDLSSGGGGPMPSMGPPGGGGGGSDDDSDDGQEPQRWFTGGERSGLSVQAPDNRGGAPGGLNVVRDILRKAAENGTGLAQAPPAGPASVFSGSGHTLGSDEVESQFVPDPNAPPPVDEDERAFEQERVVRELTFWRDGFSVDDGPLRRYDDPQWEHVLEQISQGHAPPEVLNVRIGQPVEVRVARRMTEDYVPPAARPMRAFAGSGHRLGSPVPTLVPSGGSGQPAAMPGSFPGGAAVPSAVGSSADREPESITTRFEVDMSAPTTSVQVRLADGTRLVCRMNHTHTVGDIRNFINASRPGASARPYTIQTTFPVHVLEDDKQTIKEAGLLNSVVVQRWA